MFKRHNANDSNRKGHNRATQATPIRQWHGRWWLTIGFKKKKKKSTQPIEGFRILFSNNKIILNLV